MCYVIKYQRISLLQLRDKVRSHIGWSYFRRFDIAATSKFLPPGMINLGEILLKMHEGVDIIVATIAREKRIPKLEHLSWPWHPCLVLLYMGNRVFRKASTSKLIFREISQSSKEAIVSAYNFLHVKYIL